MTPEKYVSAYKAYLEELPKIEEWLRTRLDGDFMPVGMKDMTKEQVREEEDKLDRECFPEKYRKKR